jgi:hypothetical protein
LFIPFFAPKIPHLLKSIVQEDLKMENLPPFGWADVARKSDIDRLDARIDSLIGAMWAVSAIFTACFIGLFTLIATKL